LKEETFMESENRGREKTGPAEENNHTEKQADAVSGKPLCIDSSPGAASGAGQDECDELSRVRRLEPEDRRDQPDLRPAHQPEPDPFVQEKFRKTELHDTPPTPGLADRVVRKNSIKYLAGQVDSIQDRLDRIESRLERAIFRFDRRIDDLEDRRWQP
jgi:hypothetical protein